MTRGELIERTGLARSTLSQRLEALLSSGLVQQGNGAPSTGGRPPSTLTFNAQAGVVLSADIGATHAQVAVADLAGAVRSELTFDLDIAEGPEAVLRVVERRFGDVLAAAGHEAAEVRAIGVGVPGPVEFATGRPINPPIMPGWHGFPVAQLLGERYGVPVLVDNDVNIMALGEHRSTWPGVQNLVYVKVGTGIGCGIVAGGDIYRGDQGTAGDIGHVQVSGYDDVLCECGNAGCLEAVASGRALARQARAQGLEAQTSREFMDLVRARDLRAVRLVREGGRVLGQVLAMLVNALNPAVIVIGGDIAGADQQLFAGVRETVYKRSTPLATQRLQIVRSDLADHAGVRGAAVMAIEHVLAPGVVDRALVAAGAARRAEQP
jgi:predicted NBD/HSP70 family sugar kinase